MDREKIQESNYDKVYGQFRQWFLESHKEVTAVKLGLELSEEYMLVPFFGEICKVNLETGDIEGEGTREISVVEKLTVMHHLHYYRADAWETVPRVPFREIREAAVFEQAYVRSALEPLKKAFAGCPENLLQAGVRLGGRQEKYGDVSVCIPAFPKISLTYIFWDGDEEFPPSANILFPETIVMWTHPESVPTLAQLGTQRLIERAGLGDVLR